jgi:hypothetical protein
MPSDATLVIDADTGKAIRELAKLAVEQTRIEKGADAIAKAHKRSETSLGDFLKRGASIASVTGGFTAFLNVLKEIDRDMMKIAEDMNKVNQAGVPLLSTNPDALPEELKRVAAYQGARYGVDAATSMDILQRMQSVFGGDMALGTKGAEEVYQLMRLGATSEGAAQVVQFGKERGLSPEQASALGLITADRSAQSLTQIGGTFSALNSYQDPALAGAVLAGISGSYKNAEQLTIGAQRAIEGVKSDSDFRTAMIDAAKGQGKDFMGMSEIDRLRFVREQMGGKILPEDFEAKGLKEELQKEGLAAIMRNLPTIEQYRNEMIAADPKLSDQKILKMARDTGTTAAWSASETKAMQEYERTFGDQKGKYGKDTSISDEAALNELKAVATARALRENGLALPNQFLAFDYVNQETGMPTLMGYGRMRFPGAGTPTYTEEEAEAYKELRARTLKRKWEGREFELGPHSYERQELMELQSKGYGNGSPGRDPATVLEELLSETKKTNTLLQQTPVQTPSTKGPAALQE